MCRPRPDFFVLILHQIKSNAAFKIPKADNARRAARELRRRKKDVTLSGIKGENLPDPEDLSVYLPTEPIGAESRWDVTNRFDLQLPEKEGFSLVRNSSLPTVQGRLMSNFNFQHSNLEPRLVTVLESVQSDGTS